MLTTSILKTNNQNRQYYSQASLENQLLISLAFTKIEESNTPHIRSLIERGISWKKFIEISYLHGILPLIYWNLSKNFSDLVPSEIIQELQLIFNSSVRRNLFLTGELIKIIEVLEKNDIQVIPFKGSILAWDVYQNISLRQFCDLDLLIHKKDFLKVKKLMSSQGYTSIYPTAKKEEVAYLNSLVGIQEEKYLNSHWELHMVHQNTGSNVDIHSGIMPQQFSCLYETEWLWEHIKPVSITGKNISNFTPEILLLILCAQGTKDCWNQLKRVCDISELIRSTDNIKWEEAYEQASQLGMSQMLLAGLLLNHKLLNTKLPTYILQKIEDKPVVKSLVKQIEEQIIFPAEDLQSSEKLSNSLFHLKIMDRWKDKIRYFLFLALNPSVGDWVSVSLPEQLSFLYPVIRPLRLIWQYVLEINYQPKN